MDKCPKCNQFAVGFDSYRGVTRCMVDGCSCIVIDEHSYSFLKPDPSTRTVDRVQIEHGTQIAVLRKFSLA